MSPHSFSSVEYIIHSIFGKNVKSHSSNVIHYKSMYKLTIVIGIMYRLREWNGMCKIFRMLYSMSKDFSVLCTYTSYYGPFHLDILFQVCVSKQKISISYLYFLRLCHHNFQRISFNWHKIFLLWYVTAPEETISGHLSCFTPIQYGKYRIISEAYYKKATRMQIA